MKNRITVLVLALAAFAASAETFRGAQGSVAAVEGTSTLHAWKMQSARIGGQIDAPTSDRWNAPARAVVTIPVVSIRSEHAKTDKLMAEALKANENPEIRYEMTSATPKKTDEASFVLATQGKLTIAGVTRDVAFDVHGSRDADGRYTLVGQTAIRMTHYGIKPPTAMMGAIRTGDDVKVTFRWVVERTR